MVTIAFAMTSVGTAEAAQGEIAYGKLSIGEDRGGQPVHLPVAVINGAEPGDTLYIQSVSDGDELNGLGAVTRFLRAVDPGEVTGTIIVIAITNYHAFLRARHRNPIDHTKLNRAYPGDAEGSSSDRIAAKTFEIASQADIALDLHQGSTSRMINETRVRCGRHHDLHDACLELARVFDTGHILDQQGPDGQLARVLADEGIPTVNPELGGSVGWDEESVEIGERGIWNVLTAYGFTEGSVEPSEQSRIGGFDQYYSPCGGLVEFSVDLGVEVGEGDELYTVISPLGQVRETVTAVDDGIFWRSTRLPQVATGEYVCSVGTDIDAV